MGHSSSSSQVSEASSAEVVSQPQQPASSTWIIENNSTTNNLTEKITTNNLIEKPMTPVKNKKQQHQNQIHHHHKNENVINKLESTPKKPAKLVNGNNNHAESTDEDKTPSPIPTVDLVAPKTPPDYQQQNMVSRARRAVSEDIRNHSESVVRNNHQAHPDHEDEVILRRKLREEKVELEDNNSEDAPIVPVLRPQQQPPAS